MFGSSLHPVVRKRDLCRHNEYSVVYMYIFFVFTIMKMITLLTLRCCRYLLDQWMTILPGEKEFGVPTFDQVPPLRDTYILKGCPATGFAV